MAVAPAARRPTAQHRAASALRAAILDGELAPGQRVNQEDWAARAGVSAIPVREALNALAGEGLVTYRPRRGYVVTELQLADLEEVYALRRLLETEALLRGVPRATPEDVRELRRADDDYGRAAAGGDIAASLAANRAFHDHLFGLAESGPLSRLIGLLWDQTEVYRALYYTLQGEIEESRRAHAAVVGAVEARNAAAAVRHQDAHRDRALARLRITFAA